MIIQYSFDNYCSFYGNMEFDMTSPGGKVIRRYPDNITTLPNGYSLLKSAVAVGENAGGKSNFIGSLRYLRSLFTSTDLVKAIRPYINQTSLSEEQKPVQTFSLSVSAQNGRIYDYTLSINEDGIVSEALYKRPKKSYKPIRILYADYSNDTPVIEAGTDLRYSRSLTRSTKNMGLHVTRLALLGDDDAAAFVQWMIQYLETDILSDTDNRDIAREEDDLRILNQKEYLDIFRMVDPSICAVKIDPEKPFSKSLIVRKNRADLMYERELQIDSAGVRDFFSWAVQIYRVVYENKTVFADEMDRVLNPILSSRVVAYINGKQHSGQFIFTTHNVLHLDLKQYMKEQIYFITKNPETLISDLFSLSDFPEVRYETPKIYEFYLKGILGGTTGE